MITTTEFKHDSLFAVSNMGGKIEACSIRFDGKNGKNSKNVVFSNSFYMDTHNSIVIEDGDVSITLYIANN